MRILGVDFSGARDAGTKIFVAEAQLGNDNLRVTQLLRGDELPSSSVERDSALHALCDFILREPCVAGLDFPFSLHEELVPNWNAWLQNVTSFENAETWRDAIKLKTGGKEPKRATDIEAKAPFAPLNHRLFRQTFYGVRDVLAPCVQRGACVLPMQPRRPDASCLIEICPASTLKRVDLYQPYKEKTPLHEQARASILFEVQARADFEIAPDLRDRAVSDVGGDALDALIALWATRRALQNPAQLDNAGDVAAREGRIYF